MFSSKYLEIPFHLIKHVMLLLNIIFLFAVAGIYFSNCIYVKVYSFLFCSFLGTFHHTSNYICRFSQHYYLRKWWDKNGFIDEEKNRRRINSLTEVGANVPKKPKLKFVLTRFKFYRLQTMFQRSDFV